MKELNCIQLRLRYLKTQLVQLNLETKITQLQYPKDKNANKLKQFLFSPYFSVYTHIHTPMISCVMKQSIVKSFFFQNPTNYNYLFV